LVSGRAVRAEGWLHLHDQQARQAKAAGAHPNPGSGARAAGAATAPSNGGWRRGIAAVSTRPSIKPPTRSSASPSGSERAPCWWVIPRGSPSGMSVGCRIFGCGSGAAPTCWGHSRTRPNGRGSWCGWWTSAAAARPARSAAGGSPSPRAAGSTVPTVACRGHRDLVGARNIAAKQRGGCIGTEFPVLVEHRRAGIVPARRDRRRHLHDQRRRRSCPAPGHPAAAAVAVWVSLVICRVVSCGWRGSDGVAQPSKRCLKGH
jgi:hypothetical protein